MRFKHGRNDGEVQSLSGSSGRVRHGVGNQRRSWKRTGPSAPSVREGTSVGMRYGVYVGALLLLAFVFIIPHVFAKTLTTTPKEYIEVTVLPGQTLWEIAGEHKAPRTDTRRMIDQIRTANELSSASVYPGQVLLVPVGN